VWLCHGTQIWAFGHRHGKVPEKRFKGYKKRDMNLPAIDYLKANQRIQI